MTLFHIMRPWDRRGLELARLISTWSKDPSTQVGAALLSPDHRVISVGFNGFPQGIADTPERLNERRIKYQLILHAEHNALIFAGERARGATLYTYPIPPCSRCALDIIQFGVKNVVSVRMTTLLDSRWAQECLAGRKLLQEAEIDADYSYELD